MIYTVGLSAKYEAALDHPTGVWKAARRAPAAKHPQPYEGGWVWQTADEALAYLVANNSQDIRRVYGVLADWDSDTDEIAGKPYRCLLRRARVVRL